MVEANIKLLNGDTATVYAKDHVELFKMLDTSLIAEFHTRLIELKDMRQGREKKQEGQKT